MTKDDEVDQSFILGEIKYGAGIALKWRPGDASKSTHLRFRELRLVSRNLNHIGARVLSTASAGIELCLGRISGPFANPRAKRV